MEPMQPRDFTLSELVSFGYYLLSKKRDSMTSDLFKESVTGADIANWRAKDEWEHEEFLRAIGVDPNDVDIPPLPEYLQNTDWMNEPVKYDCTDNDNHIVFGADEIKIGTPLKSDGMIVISKKDLNNAIMLFNLRFTWI